MSSFTHYFNPWLFSLLISMLLCALLCVTSKNPINSVLFLMICFTNLSILLLFLGTQFISLLILFIYVGAISILLIFVLMILDLKALFFENFSTYFYNVLFLLFIFSAVLLLVFRNFSFFSVVYKNSDWNSVDFISILYMQSDIKVLGLVLFNFYFYHFFLLSLILLFVLVGAISIVIEKKGITKKQYYKDQVKNFVNVLDSANLVTFELPEVRWYKRRNTLNVFIYIYSNISVGGIRPYLRYFVVMANDLNRSIKLYKKIWK